MKFQKSALRLLDNFKILARFKESPTRYHKRHGNLKSERRKIDTQGDTGPLHQKTGEYAYVSMFRLKFSV